MADSANFHFDHSSISMYEGDLPYIFISYSHRDSSAISEITHLLRSNQARFWYDNGLHSGDDWNMVIASHLERATACLVLLSKSSTQSPYIKNELNFANNHRIPIHAMRIDSSDLPIDIEMMIGRIHMLEKEAAYERALLESLPGEIFASNAAFQPDQGSAFSHPLFDIKTLKMNRQGTVSYLGEHRLLKYPVWIQEDPVDHIDARAVIELSGIVCLLKHPLFPKIIDVQLDGPRMRTFQEYRGEVFLDHYLAEHRLSEEQITEWTLSVIDAMEYLYSRNLGLRDFSRGSMVVLDDGRIGMFRLQNVHYGVVRLRPENRQYYFETEVQEIAILLHQLCTGEVPVLPLTIVQNDAFSKTFLNRVNLVIQKCIKEDNHIPYHSFRELKDDLTKNTLSISERRFLNRRKTKLEEYERTKKANLERVFTSTESRDISSENIEERFGFEATIILPFDSSTGDASIKIRNCASGEIYAFSKTEITVGRATDCDLILNQPAVSRYHLKIESTPEGDYLVTDLNTSNGSYATSALGSGDEETKKLMSGKKERISRNWSIRVGTVYLQLL